MMNNPIPAQAQDPLAQLADIHLPEQISLWPPAPGWWIAGILLLGSLVYLMVKLIRYIRHNRYRREAIIQLDRLVQRYWLEQAECDNKATHHFLSRFNGLLKQVAITAYSRHDVSSLSPKKWVAFLDKTAKTAEFSSGIGYVLAEEMYKPEVRVDINSLHKLGIRWIKKHRQKYHD